MIVGKPLDTPDVALALGFREGGHEFVHGEAAFGAVAVCAGGDNVVDAAGAAQGTRNDVVVGDALDGKRGSAIDAAAVGFVGKDGERTWIALILFQAFPGPQEGEILHEEPGLILADTTGQEGRFHAPPIGQTFAEGKSACIFRNGQAVFVADTVAAEDSSPLYADFPTAAAVLDLCHGPVPDLFLPTAAEKASAGAFLEKKGPLLSPGKGGFVVADIAGAGGTGHGLLEGGKPDFRATVTVGIEDLGDGEDEAVAIETGGVDEVGHLLLVEVGKGIILSDETVNQVVEIAFRQAHERALLRQLEDHHLRPHLRMLAAFVVQEVNVADVGINGAGQGVALLHHTGDGSVRHNHICTEHELEGGLFVGQVLLDAALRDHGHNIQRAGAGDFRGKGNLIVQHVSHVHGQRLLQGDVPGIEVLPRQRVTRRLQLGEDVGEDVLYGDVDVQFEGEVHGYFLILTSCKVQMSTSISIYMIPAACPVPPRSRDRSDTGNIYELLGLSALLLPSSLLCPFKFLSSSR